MKNLANFIQEKFLIDNTYTPYTCQPKDKFELHKILEERLKKDKDADLNDIDVSKITDMGYRGFPDNKGLFEGLDPHNIDISLWDVSNVEDMSGMFFACENFNSNLSNWQVGKVTNMASMFLNCINFNSNLSNWNVSNVKDTRWMFHKCKNFTGEGLENWPISKVISMEYMFKECTSLKKIPSWYIE